MRKNSIKNTRINGEVQRVLAEIIRSEIKDPRVPEFTSVVAVDVAPDLKSCKAYVSVFGDEGVEEEAIKGLTSAAGFIRRELANELNLRNTPDIRFYLDRSIAYGVDMSHKIDQVIESDNSKHQEDQ
jgi:ribosome-binding factor A